MSTHHLGSDIGRGARFEYPALDERLRLVLDWLDGADRGLGEVIDRLQHLSACRSLVRRFPDGLPDGGEAEDAAPRRGRETASVPGPGEPRNEYIVRSAGWGGGPPPGRDDEAAEGERTARDA